MRYSICLYSRIVEAVIFLFDNQLNPSVLFQSTPPNMSSIQLNAARKKAQAPATASFPRVANNTNNT
jgi:hypothetical protein